MILSQLLHSPMFWWLAFGSLFLYVVNTPYGKGKTGELMVKLQAWFCLDKSVYHVVHNVTIPADEGQGTTQIDHLYVSKYGVFVVETKHISGWIFGSANDATWTQKFRNGKSRQFQNPLRQNYKHTKTLAALLELPEDKLISLVVFNGETKFKTPMPENVCYSLGHIDFVKKHQAEILGEDEVIRILQVIEEKRLAPGFKTDRQHVAYVRARIETPAQPGTPSPTTSAQALCPHCGAPLVQRTARQGANAGRDFWGCSTYPRCRYTKNV